jgi:hypothetical protein
MRISQRGTSFTSIALNATTYTLDRWATGGGGTTAVGTITQSTDTPNSTFPYSFKLDVTTADASVAATDRSHIVQQIEGHNVVDLIGQTFTLSFWVKSPKTGTHCVSFQNSGSDRSYVTEYTVSVANTWEYKTVAVTGGLITAGTWDFANGSGLKILFALMVGSTYQGTAGSWLTGNFQGTSSQVNVLDNTANDFFLCGVQLEPGSVATPFERRSYGQELALCQRYYQVSDTAVYGTMESSGATARRYATQFPVQMRATPTVTGTASGGSFVVDSSSKSTLRVYVNVGNSTNSGSIDSWVASIEL